jgi:peptidyl-prolyl cis-trans isomerase C
MKLSLQKHLITLLVSSCMTATVWAQAQALPKTQGEKPVVVLVKANGGLQVTSNDIMSELQRAPENIRESVMSRPEALQQLANNLIVRRILAAEGARDGLEKDPVVAASLEIARDRALSDARLARLDAQNQPTEAAIEAYARNLYQANSSQFEKPPEARARHILIDNTGAESLDKAKELLKQLRNGASFEELAKAHSTDKGSAARGGDLGFFGPGKMVRPFEDAVNALKAPGDLSEPVESQFGYHIIRLEERREKSKASFEEVREQLLGEAKVAIMNASRLQKVRSMTNDIIFDTAVIEQLVKSGIK